MGSFSPETATSSSQSQSGMFGPERAAINARSPGDIAQLWNAGTTAYNTNIDLPSLTPNGLYAPQENAFRNAIQMANSQFSGAAAGRGQLSPDNIGAIAGSAVQNVLPQFAPMIGENIRNATLIPEAIRQNRFGALNQILANYPGLLGSTSSSQSNHEGSGLGFNAANSFLTSFGGSLGKSAGGAVSGGMSGGLSALTSKLSSAGGY